MKALGLLGILIVLVAVGMFVAYFLSSAAARRQAKRAAATPWMAREEQREGSWVVEAYRPGHAPIVLASQPIEPGRLSMAVEQARSDAYEHYMALKPRGRWEL